MAPHGRPPFRADHIGSLLRPASLRQGFRDHASGLIDDDEFAEIQDEAIADAVAMQSDVGLSVVTDGEFRRASYWSRFVERVSGLAIRDAQFRFRDDGGEESEFTAPYAETRVTRVQPLAVDEFQALVRIAEPVGVRGKITLPAPSSMHFWRGRDFCDPGTYATATELFEDLARIYRSELEDLAAVGCTYVQFDEVAIAMLCDADIRLGLSQDGLEPDVLLNQYIDAINSAVANRPQELTVGLHLCRGNFKGKYLAAGGYELVAERLFVRADVDVFLLEFDTARAGDFAPLRHMPRNKAAVLGLLCSKSPRLETLEELRQRVDDAAEYIDPDQLGISPQCGFASTVAGNPVTTQIQRAKLSRTAEAARTIWG